MPQQEVKKQPQERPLEEGLDVSPKEPVFIETLINMPGLKPETKTQLAAVYGATRADAERVYFTLSNTATDVAQSLSFAACIDEGLRKDLDLNPLMDGITRQTSPAHRAQGIHRLMMFIEMGDAASDALDNLYVQINDLTIDQMRKELPRIIKTLAPESDRPRINQLLAVLENINPGIAEKATKLIRNNSTAPRDRSVLNLGPEIQQLAMVRPIQSGFETAAAWAYVCQYALDRIDVILGKLQKMDQKSGKQTEKLEKVATGLRERLGAQAADEQSLEGILNTLKELEESMGLIDATTTVDESDLKTDDLLQKAVLIEQGLQSRKQLDPLYRQIQDRLKSILGGIDHGQRIIGATIDDNETRTKLLQQLINRYLLYFRARRGIELGINATRRLVNTVTSANEQRLIAAMGDEYTAIKADLDAEINQIQIQTRDFSEGGRKLVSQRHAAGKEAQTNS